MASAPATPHSRDDRMKDDEEEDMEAGDRNQVNCRYHQLQATQTRDATLLCVHEGPAHQIMSGHDDCTDPPLRLVLHLPFLQSCFKCTSKGNIFVCCECTIDEDDVVLPFQTERTKLRWVVGPYW